MTSNDWTDEDIARLRGLANRDQDDAAYREYIFALAQHIRDLTPELDRAQVAQLIPSADHERYAIRDAWWLVNDAWQELAEAIVQRRLEIIQPLTQRVFTLGWMAALDKHHLVPEPETPDDVE